MRYPISLISYLLAFIALFSAGNVYARSARNESLSTALNSDGSVKRGVAGSFDPNGFRMRYGSKGEPKFFAAGALSPSDCSDRWDTSFAINGADNSVYAVIADGTGNVYIGGGFTGVHGIAASRIAKWNGTTWTALGSGLAGGLVLDIAIFGSDVYAAGSFSSAGGAPANHVAKWNGTSWSAMGAGLGANFSGWVNAIEVLGTDIFAGGTFNTQTGFPNNIARWDGAAWVNVGTGMDDEVTALAVSGTDLIAGGRFDNAGGVPASAVARWNGTAWSAMGAGFPSRVLTIAVSGPDIYVGGSLGSGNGNLAKWNGTSWESLGTGVGGFGTQEVTDIALSGTDVYVGGYFSTAGGTQAKSIAKWNGTQWSALGSGVGEDVSNGVGGMAFLGTTLVVGGNFAAAGGIEAKNIVTWNGGTWTAFNGSSLDNETYALAVSGTDVYVGGRFTKVGSLSVNKIAKWNDSTWSSLGTGVAGNNSYIWALAVSGGYLYAAGTFTEIGGVTASGIARWNGASWSALGTGVTGMNASIYVMTVVDGDLYVGGSFDTAGGLSANRIAKWNGSTWSSLPGSAIIPNSVTAIAAIGSNLYIGSTTNTADNPNYLLKFDGTNWTGLSSGFGGHGISSLSVIGSDLYVGGAFPSIGGLTVNRIAKWNGSWSALSSGLPGNSSRIKTIVMGGELIAFGDFTSPGSGIARWNGSAWSPLGNGLGGGYGSVGAAHGGNLYAAGSFATAGCNLSPYFARWRETVWTGSTNTDWHTATNWGSGTVPAPNSGATISASNATITSADVILSSLVVTGGRSLAIAGGRTLTVTGDLDIDNGAITGPGILIVNGNVRQNGDIFGLGSLTINGSLTLIAGRIDGGPVRLTSCNAAALTGGSSTALIQSSLTRCVNSTGTFRFPVGTGAPGGYGPVELSGVVGSGDFTVEPKSGGYPGVVTGLPSNRLQRWWNTSSTGGITQANLVFGYLDSEVVGVESRYRAYRIDAGTATQLPTTLDQIANRATANGVTSFAAWSLAEGQPGIATMNGRVTRPNGRPAWGVIITLMDDQGNLRYTQANPFGYFKFTDLPIFRLYTVRVTSKKFTFSAPERSFEFDENSVVNFVSSDN